MDYTKEYLEAFGDFLDIDEGKKKFYAEEAEEQIEEQDKAEDEGPAGEAAMEKGKGDEVNLSDMSTSQKLSLVKQIIKSVDEDDFSDFMDKLEDVVEKYEDKKEDKEDSGEEPTEEAFDEFDDEEDWEFVDEDDDFEDEEEDEEYDEEGDVGFRNRNGIAKYIDGSASAQNSGRKGVGSSIPKPKDMSKNDAKGSKGYSQKGKANASRTGVNGKIKEAKYNDGFGNEGLKGVKGKGIGSSKVAR